MNTRQAIPVTHAAAILGVGSVTLFRELRARGILLPCNTPAPEYRQSGEMLLQFAEFYLPRTRIKQIKPCPHVTVAGWHLVETIAREIRHGQTQAAAPVRSRNLSAADQHATQGSAGAHTATPPPPHFYALAASL